MTNDEIIKAARRLRMESKIIADRIAVTRREQPRRIRRITVTKIRRLEICRLEREQRESTKTFAEEQRPIAIELLTGPMTKREISERFGVTLEEVRAIAARLFGGESVGNCVRGAA